VTSQPERSAAVVCEVACGAHGWRSLAPITHSISTSVYTPDLFFDFNSDPALQALDIMKQLKAVSAPNVLNTGTTDAGVNNTPDEDAFAAQQAAYFVKYQNAPLRFAATWPDPSGCSLDRCPSRPPARVRRSSGQPAPACSSTARTRIWPPNI
jgi:hypothetical protein